MDDLFFEYISKDEEDYRRLFTHATIVFDTNAILNLFRYGQPVRDALIEVLNKLIERLWFPHQVALEFHIHKWHAIESQITKSTKASNEITECLSTAINKLNSVNDDKKHVLVSLDSFLDSLSQLRDQYQSDNSNEDLRVKTKKELSDLVLPRIEQLLIGRTGEPFQQEELDDLYELGATRYKNFIPPGYHDASKKADEPPHCYRMTTIQRQYGDLILWQQLLRDAKSHSWKEIILVTDDTKADWWWEVEKDKRVGPRPELVWEAFQESGIELFHMYTSDQFLKYYNKYANGSIAPEIIDDIKITNELTQKPENQVEFYATPDQDLTHASSIGHSLDLSSPLQYLRLLLNEHYNTLNLHYQPSPLGEKTEISRELRRSIRSFASVLPNMTTTLTDIENMFEALESSLRDFYIPHSLLSRENFIATRKAKLDLENYIKVAQDAHSLSAWILPLLTSISREFKTALETFDAIQSISHRLHRLLHKMRLAVKSLQ